ncbi:MAG: KpsF/GutQ family sugar-phosphate isomerase [Limnohabitans sp.]|nr:KpsF/GutQ family sugar-phosphate isomerase [Limnohabitans sp.]
MNTNATTQHAHILALARQTMEIEAQAILSVQRQLGDQFVHAVQGVLSVKGRVVVMGMGKSGHIGRKIAATLASTGTPAFFVHPAEASHGDLGMVTRDDLVIALSNSGESEELSAILPLIKRLGVMLLAITGNPQSTLANYATWVLDSSVEKEACPMNLAPTASTTAQLALGDALAVAVLDARGFKQDDFARSHPGGSLGRRLLTLLSDIMRTGEQLPTVTADVGLTELMREMSQKGLGTAAIVDQDRRVLGIFTDGDLRRLIERGVDLRAMRASEVMRTQPSTLRDNAFAVVAAELMELKQITCVLVVNAQGSLCGVVNSNDLMRAKVI